MGRKGVWEGVTPSQTLPTGKTSGVAPCFPVQGVRGECTPRQVQGGALAAGDP